MSEITELKGLVTKLLPVKLLENNNGQIEGVPKNPRFIKDWRYKLLLQSLTESPEMLSLKELWVYKVGNIYVVIAGNMRLRGSKEKGYKSLPCKILPPETSVEKLKEYAIKDNAGYGDWEMDSLANEWESPKIVEWGVELHGWENGEMPFEESETAEAKEDDFDTTPPEVAKTVLGDLYEIGEHRVLCGDSTDSDAVSKLMNGEKADMVFTDPPYGMHLDVSNSNNLGCKDGWKNKAKNYTAVIGDGDDFKEELINTIFACFNDVKEVFIWGADYFAELIPNKNQGSWLVWDKRFGVEEMKLTFSEFELCWSKEKHLREMVRITWSGILGTEQEFDHKRHHPTQKPTKLSRWFIEKYSSQYNLIADIYLGSGSTMVASHQLKRKCYGMEISPQYTDVTIKRMLSLDSTLRVKRNGVDVTEEWRA